MTYLSLDLDRLRKLIEAFAYCVSDPDPKKAGERHYAMIQNPMTAATFILVRCERCSLDRLYAMTEKQAHRQTEYRCPRCESPIPVTALSS